MPALHDELSEFACAIVLGMTPSARIETAYANHTLRTGIEVYRNNYRGNLHDALAGAYPVVEQLVGADFFRLLTRHYIGQYFSRSANLHHYGERMADFVAGFEPAATLPYLPDVARLEWACHCAYFAEDCDGLDLQRLAGIPAARHPDLVLQLHPACRLVRSRYPVAAIWHAHQADAPADFHIDLDAGPSNALVCRIDDVVVVDELGGADADWLQAVLHGATLDAATTATLAQHPDFNLQNALLNLTARQALAGFSLEETP